jgi:hypothetical protein
MTSAAFAAAFLSHCSQGSFMRGLSLPLRMKHVGSQGRIVADRQWEPARLYQSIPKIALLKGHEG